jgi:acyl-coenzyme A synthetase/AMP-(fatty) acid ligase
VGRLRDILKNVHGEIVSCREIEDALLSLPGVTDATVLRVEDRDGMERSLAFVVPTTAPTNPTVWVGALRESLFLRLGPKRMPSQILLREKIPRNGMGKVRREQLAFSENLSL